MGSLVPVSLVNICSTLWISCTYLGHDDILTTKAVIWVGVIVVDVRNWNVGTLTQVLHRRDLGLCLEPWHETASDTRNYFFTARECD